MGLRCKRCGSEEHVKNGLMRGQQRNLRKGCGLNFTNTPARGKPLAMKAAAVLLYVSGLSMNDVLAWDQNLRAKCMRAAAVNTKTWSSGDGEMARRIREHDWAATPLGPHEGWPQSLRTTVGLMLPAQAQIVLF